MIYTTNISMESEVTVFLAAHIEYEDQVWDETVSYVITIVNPCVNTAIYYNETIFEEMSYEIGATANTQSFTPVTDTITNAITTSGSCGNIVYTLKNNDTAVGTGFIYTTDLLNAKGLRIYTEDEGNIGNYTITITATMENYPEKTTQFTVDVLIKEPLADLPARVSYAPVLDTDLSEGFRLEP